MHGRGSRGAFLHAGSLFGCVAGSVLVEDDPDHLQVDDDEAIELKDQILPLAQGAGVRFGRAVKSW